MKTDHSERAGQGSEVRIAAGRSVVSAARWRLLPLALAAAMLPSALSALPVSTQRVFTANNPSGLNANVLPNVNVGNGANRLLLVGLSDVHNTGTNSLCSAVSWNGQALTLLYEWSVPTNWYSGTLDTFLPGGAQVWALSDPPSGTANVLFTTRVTPQAPNAAADPLNSMTAVVFSNVSAYTAFSNGNSSMHADRKSVV